jgi:hypothetical protein
MNTANQSLLFDDAGSRHVQADFSGGHLSSNGGALLLRQIDRGLGVSRSLAACFLDRRDPRYVEHSLESLIAQRVHGLALGYEDLNDHNELRRDPLLAVCADKSDPLGLDRIHPQDQGKALASAPTLNRLELGTEKTTRCHKIEACPQKIEQTLLQMGVRCLPRDLEEVVLDLDAMGHILHGTQEGRFFSGYYGEYCYLPLYIFAGNIPLWAQLRTADQDAAAGVVEALIKVAAALRKRFPGVRIIVRGDSGFARPKLMDWCEDNGIFYCLGLPRNERLEVLLQPAMDSARARFCLIGGVATRVFKEFQYATLKTWRCQRRVIGKAEITSEGENPRFIVTNLLAKEFSKKESERVEPANLYEDLYCARGQMENVLKQQVLDLEADRMSTHYLGSNQLRLWLSTFAYLLLERLRALTLQGTELAAATAGTIRLRLFKVAAIVRVSVRRVYVQMASSFPMQALYAQCLNRLKQINWQAG